MLPFFGRGGGRRGSEGLSRDRWERNRKPPDGRREDKAIERFVSSRTWYKTEFCSLSLSSRGTESISDQWERNRKPAEGTKENIRD